MAIPIEVVSPKKPALSREGNIRATREQETHSIIIRCRKGNTPTDEGSEGNRFKGIGGLKKEIVSKWEKEIGTLSDDYGRPKRNGASQTNFTVD
jgi:hypothetical protein